MKVSNDSERKRRNLSRIYADCFEAELRRKERENDPKVQEIKKDSDERILIQSDIINMIKEGKGRIEILDSVTNKYKDSRYCMNISKWYEHHYAKIKEQEEEKDKKHGEAR